MSNCNSSQSVSAWRSLIQQNPQRTAELYQMNPELTTQAILIPELYPMLRFIKNPSLELCKRALAQDVNTLKYLHCKLTPELKQIIHSHCNFD